MGLGWGWGARTIDFPGFTQVFGIAPLLTRSKLAVRSCFFISREAWAANLFPQHQCSEVHPAPWDDWVWGLVLYMDQCGLARQSL